MRALLLTVCVVALATFVRADDESYTIKLRRYPAPGKSMTVRNSTKTTTSAKFADADGNLVKDSKQKQELHEEVTETTLVSAGMVAGSVTWAWAGPRLTAADGALASWLASRRPKFERAYSKARLDSGTGSTAEPHEGKVVVFELKGNRFVVRLKGKGELPGLDRDRLTRQAAVRRKGGIDTVFVPDRAVKVGEKWAVPGRKLATLPLADIDPARSRGEGKLVKVYQKAGRRWGTLSFKATLALRKLDKIAFDPPATMKLEGTLDAPVDGSAPARRLAFTATLAGKGKIEEANRSLSVDMKTRLESKDEREE